MSVGYEVRAPWAKYQEHIQMEKELLEAVDLRDFTTFQYVLHQPDIDHNSIARCFEHICNKNDCEIFAKILLTRINPNTISVFGKKPIHLAAIAGNAALLDILLKYPHIDVNSSDKRGWTALHYIVQRRVASSDDIDKIQHCLRVLLKHPDLDINKRCSNALYTGVTALHLAVVAEKDYALAFLLRDKRIYINAVDEKGRTALHYAAEQNNITNMVHTNIELLLDRSDIDVNKHDEKGRTPLHAASELNNYAAIEVLLGDPRIKINEEDINGKTVLHYEADKNDRNSLRKTRIERALSFLMDSRRDIDVNRVDNEGKAAIHIAAEKGNLTVMKILLMDKGTNVNLQDSSGRTVLHCIAERHESDPERLDSIKLCVSLLLDGPETIFNIGTISTVMSGRTENSRYTLDINAEDINGETALHKAASVRNQHLILTLLRHGASIRMKFSESVLEGIAPSTLQTFLNECIEDNKTSLHSEDYALIFNYTFLSENQKKQQTPETEPLLCMSQSRKLRHLLKHPVISSFIDLKWQRVQALYYVNVVIYTLFLISLNSYVLYSTHLSPESAQDVPGYISVPLKIILGYMWLRELFELLTYPCNYLKSIENYLEVILLGLTVIILFKKGAWQTCEIRRILYVATLLLCWLEWVLLTGRLPFLSIQVEMLKTVSLTFLTFMAWYSFIIIAFSISFYILFKQASNEEGASEKSPGPFQDIASALFKTIIMMAGEFEADSLLFYSAPNIARHLVLVFFVILIAIIMLNLLNGLAVSDTQTIKKQALLLSQVSRVKSSFYIESIGLIDESPYCITKKLLCNFPFLNLRKLFNHASFFANIGNEMKVYIFPNRGGRVSYNKPIRKSNESSPIIQYSFAKVWGLSYMVLDTKIIKDSIDIATNQKSDASNSLREWSGISQQIAEQYEQKLENIERKLEEVIQLVSSLTEHRKIQTSA